MIRELFQAVRRAYLDATLRSGPDLRVRIFERPGLWMDAADLVALQGQLRTVASKTLPVGDLTYGVFAEGGTGLNQTIITLVTTTDGTPVAFNELAVMEVDAAPRSVEVLHLGLVMVDPAYQQQNLSWVLYGLTCFFDLSAPPDAPDLGVECDAGARRGRHGGRNVFRCVAKPESGAA